MDTGKTFRDAKNYLLLFKGHEGTRNRRDIPQYNKGYKISIAFFKVKDEKRLYTVYIHCVVLKVLARAS